MTSTLQTKYYLVAFLTRIKVNGGLKWQLNLSSVGGWYAGEGWQYGNPEGLKDKFKELQGQGAKVLVSFGGANFDPSDITTSEVADALAQAIAYSFLGGKELPPPNSQLADWKRVFCDWTFDGVDLDLEQSAGPPKFHNSVWVTLAKSIKKYAPKSTLTGAPQSPYLYNMAVASPYGVPFPNGANNTCGNISPPASGDFLLSTSNVHLFDALLVQFYNQYDAEEFPTEKNFPARLCQLVKLVSSSSASGQKPQIYIGVTAKGEKGSMNGVPPGVYNPEKIGNAINEAIKEAEGPNTSWWFGGIMGWQSAPVTDLVKNICAITGGGIALYGYQDGDPGW